MADVKPVPSPSEIGHGLSTAPATAVERTTTAVTVADDGNASIIKDEETPEAKALTQGSFHPPI